MTPVKTFVALIVGLMALTGVRAGVGEGQQLYDAWCQVCHGPTGEGQVMGKPLTDAMANRLDDEELIAVIRDGRNGTGMGAWKESLSAEEILDVATWVRVLQGRPGLSLEVEDSAADDPAVVAGAGLFNGKAGCIECHSYDDQGGNIGPALDGVAARLGTELEAALLDPAATIASGYAMKIVEQEDGSIVRGRYRNDSELAVQIQSADGGRWVTWFKDRVKSISDSAESLMPPVYETLSAAEQHALLAFLRSL